MFKAQGPGFWTIDVSLVLEINDIIEDDFSFFKTAQKKQELNYLERIFSEYDGMPTLI